MKAIAIDIDDTLNDFSETLQSMEFPYDEGYGIDEETFLRYIGWIKTEIPKEEIKNKDLTSLWHIVHKRIHKEANARPGAAAFVQWLKSEGWTVVILTYRDLRLAEGYTKEWLEQNDIPYDYLFSSDNKILMCKAWDITHLIEDNINDVITGENSGVNVAYPVMKKHEGLETTAKGFIEFKELETWIA